MKKTTWRMIYMDFKRRHPNLSKTAPCYRPYGYAEILIYRNDGSKMTYNYDTQRVLFNVKPREPVRIARIQQAVL